MASNTKPKVSNEEPEVKYVTMNAQTKANALIQRLQVLETEHYQQGVLAQESLLFVGGDEQAKAHLDTQTQVDQRIDYVKAQLNDLGVKFSAAE